MNTLDNPGRLFGAVIQARLVAQGKTQKAMAERFGISQKHLSQMLLGKAGMSLAFTIHALDYVGLHISLEQNEETR